MVQQPEETKLDDAPPSAFRSGSPSVYTDITAENLERLQLSGLGGDVDSPQTSCNDDNENSSEQTTANVQRPCMLLAGQGGCLPMFVYAMPYLAAPPDKPVVPQPAHGKGDVDSPLKPANDNSKNDYEPIASRNNRKEERTSSKV